VDVEDSARAGHDLHGANLVLELLEQPRRQTGGVRERPSGDAILDAYVASGHVRILAELSGTVGGARFASRPREA
jgi:hypothetical protein